MRDKIRVLIVVLALGFGWPVYAHHGYASYDLKGPVTLTGTVESLQLANPHSSISVNVKDANGTINRWNVEFGTLRGLLKQGWSAETLKQGDQVKLTVYPAKNGAHVGALQGKITYTDGRDLDLKPSSE